MASQDPICQAVNLSGGQPCTAVATTWENLFCRFHGKQCHGLYIGYKRRNAKLDALSENLPTYLRESKVPLANETFDVNDEKTLREIHAHLYQEYVLLGKVIDARKLHHKHFYSLQMDYGHQAYLDTLSSRRHIVLRALEKLETRTAQVLYEKETWYTWIREAQKEEEATREKESKKVKLEAAMFKRHWKKMEARLRTQREKEEKQRQDTYLEAAYQERMSALDSEDDAEMWDPIEDITEDERSRFVDLIKHFLWMEVLADIDENEDSARQATTSSELAVEAENLPILEDKQPKKGKKKPKSKAAKASTSQNKTKPQNATKSKDRRTGQSRIMEMIDDDEEAPGELPDPDKSNIETESEMRKRLKEGVEKNYDDIEGPIIVGTLEAPHGTHLKTAPLADEEIDSLTKDIKEIKLLLFCRLLLSHASLLPAAVRAPSVEAFLSDPEIAASDLRDLCLKVEQPSLQDIRDACADLIRGDEPEAENEEEDILEEESFEDVILQEHRYGHLQDPEWFLTNMLAQRQKLINSEGGLAKLKKNFSKKPQKQRKMKIQVCGKSIWNYSSESSMSRDGWLQFSVMAKDCDLRHAVQLCRNWDEFSRLNFLTVWQYFPASNWVSWSSDRFTQQLHELGFFPYFKDFEAQKHSHYHQVGGRSQHRRQHSFFEVRNIIVGHMRRNDSVTRRFLQYCTMRTGELLLLVRDGKTGKIITAPEEEHLWTMRRKEGLGRASKKEWEIMLEVGPEYFDMVDILRRWRLGFEDYYEVWLWDFVPCNDAAPLYNVIATELRKAWRVTKPLDIYAHREPFLRSLTRNQDTMRVRSIRPGEDAPSLWDDVTHPLNTFFTADVLNKKVLETNGDAHMEASPYLFYNEADAAEDLILFSDELISPNRNVPFREVSNSITRIETTPATMINVLAEEAREMSKRGKDVSKLPEADDDEDWSTESEYVMDDEEMKMTTHWSLPQIWEDSTAIVNNRHISSEKKQLLRRVGLLSEGSNYIRGGINSLNGVETKLRTADKTMVMEKDRGAALVEAFHAGDLEPGAQEKYAETCKILRGILGPQKTFGSTDWVWFLVDILDWLELRTDYTTYSHEARAGWPHPFITQDIVKAFMQMAMFFPTLEQCKPAKDFFESEEGSQYKDSLLFNLTERAKAIPDCRARASFKHRPKRFWNEWDALLKDAEENDKYFADVYPIKWSVAVRPILAKLYLAGIIAPAYIQNDPLVIPGFAVAGEESHRPGKLDLFMDYTDRQGAIQYPQNIPGFVSPSDWPVLLPLARAFASQHGSGARFAILRVWSAPHFYPAMLGDWNRHATAFLDGNGRSWIWKFIPKDMPISEWSMYNTLKLRLELLNNQLKVGERVVHRNEVILVMGTDEVDLLKYVTAVTFAIQTKPWHREIDLWKSFVNVDLGFLEGVDEYWLD
ncbi:uncharacterized protein GGS22DRAFT_182070 [Annulohypoxylon maeteangense]|uniref:uncharacterized protein n=1 Tax=Annulohypoxylon maeteangense TaxID=1927788 RepID=UPI0020072449|nr:uncharacterized protein GGS22DRAFT_182070 [Annulohypoxylon maeteangense]KAI0880759.1 hypothetical protein GGS22DRAFT_182070 [Annulohypoxylon maeteangense]